MLTAALDAARLGARAPLSTGLLRAAAPGYLTSQQQAEAPKKWFKQALAYATGKLHGAAAALTPVGVGIGRVDGYIVADYLVQHASRERRSARVPASTWDAVLSHIRDPAATARLAESARNRLLYRYAIPLYRNATNAGDEAAASGLADLLAARGDLEEAEQILRARADAGDWSAAVQLVGLLAERGEDDMEGLLVDLLPVRGDQDGGAQTARARADASDAVAASLLAERGDLDGLRARANAGDSYAALELAGLLADRGDLDELRARADAGDGYAARRLPDLLIEQGRGEEAEQLARFGLNPDGSNCLGVKGRRAFGPQGARAARPTRCGMSLMMSGIERLATRSPAESRTGQAPPGDRRKRRCKSGVSGNRTRTVSSTVRV